MKSTICRYLRDIQIKRLMKLYDNPCITPQTTIYRTRYTTNMGDNINKDDKLYVNAEFVYNDSLIYWRHMWKPWKTALNKHYILNNCRKGKYYSSRYTAIYTFYVEDNDDSYRYFIYPDINTRIMINIQKDDKMYIKCNKDYIEVDNSELREMIKSRINSL